MNFYFYPRPPRGGRPIRDCTKKSDKIFLSPPSARRATTTQTGVSTRVLISIPALREEGDYVDNLSVDAKRISIPALREEGDGCVVEGISQITNFYPRPPRGGRLSTKGIPVAAFRFLSPPSARRATRMPPSASRTSSISIPALREEGDLALLGVVFHAPAFLSPPSARRATRSAHCFPLALIISIPALREEGDGIIYTHSPFTLDFYPRPPRGGRRF